MPDEVEESGPYAIVVRLGVFRDQGRGDRTEEVVGSWHGAVEQEQPSGLKVRDLLEPVPEARLDCQSVAQRPLHKLGAANGRAQDDNAVSLRFEIAFPDGLLRPPSTLQKVVDVRGMGKK